MKIKPLFIFTLLGFSFFSCDKKNTAVEETSNQSDIKTIKSLPSELKEISGIAYKDNLIYAIEDSGNENQIAILDSLGQIVKKITVNESTNTDWEDLTFDKKGNLYIGDFGNNDNERKDLAIYKIAHSDLQNQEVKPEFKITFYYPEQTEFPPKKKDLKFDVEAFFEYNNSFYLFTKNRSKDFDGSSFVYKIPNSEGNHKAELINTITTCSDYDNCVITSASINLDGSKFAVLSHSKVFIFENNHQNNLTSGQHTALDLNHFSQKEAICFKNNNTLLIVDEKEKKEGGNLYEIKIE